MFIFPKKKLVIPELLSYFEISCMQFLSIQSFFPWCASKKFNLNKIHLILLACISNIKTKLFPNKQYHITNKSLGRVVHSTIYKVRSKNSLILKIVSMSFCPHDAIEPHPHVTNVHPYSHEKFDSINISLVDKKKEYRKVIQLLEVSSSYFTLVRPLDFQYI